MSSPGHRRFANSLQGVREAVRLAGFSLDRLVRFVVLLGHDVEIVVKKRPRSRRAARLLVT